MLNGKVFVGLGMEVSGKGEVRLVKKKRRRATQVDVRTDGSLKLK